MSPKYDMPPITNYETEPREVDTFVVIDLDRTVLNTSNLISLLCSLLPKFGVTAEDAIEAESMIRAADGSSLFPIGFLRGQFGDEPVDAVMDDIREMAELGEIKEMLLYRGSYELLDALDGEDVPWGIMTYGEVADQEFKLDIFRRMTNRDKSNCPAEITDKPKKSRWIHKDWYTEDGRIKIDPKLSNGLEIYAKQIVVLDDKLKNLESPDPGVKGIPIDNHSIDSTETYTVASVAELVRQGRQIESLASWYHEGKAR